MPAFRRRKKLIQPRLQIRLTGAFLGVSTLALLLQFMVFTSSLSELAADLPQDGPIVLERILTHVVWTAVVSFAVVMPISFVIGVLITFRVAGPVFRLERFLSEIIRGEKPADCRLRSGDELHELCALMNRATAVLRARADNAAADHSTAKSSAAHGELPDDPNPASLIPAGCETHATAAAHGVDRAG